MQITPENISLQNISVQDVVAYLKNTGWEQTSHPNQNFLLFLKVPLENGNQPIKLAIPKNDEFIDTPIRLATAVNVLANIEEVPPATIIHNITHLYRDILKLRLLISEQTRIPVQTAQNIIAGLHNVLAYAASLEEQKSPFFTHMLPEGRRKAQSFRFGHTFPGSFGFAIEASLPYKQLSFSFDDVLSHAPERKILERIVRGFVITQQALKLDDVSFMVNNYHRGFNANIYESLNKITEQSNEITLEYRIDWSPIIKPADDIAAFQSLRIDSSVYDFFARAARELRKDEEIAGTTRTIQGRITNLQSEYAPIEEDGKKRTMTVAYFDAQDKARKIPVVLSQPDYIQACNAHRDGNVIAVTGTLKKKVGGNWVLEEVKDFVVYEYHPAQET